MMFSAKAKPLLGLLFFLVASTARTSSAENQPNIVFLLVDDWGSGDVDLCPKNSNYNTCPFRPRTDSRRLHLHTPRMKQMAKEGQILTNFYAPRNLCVPSRSGMFTGRDPSRYGMIDNIIGSISSSSTRGGLSLSEKTVAKYLKELGYSTGFTGKWHLGAKNGTNTPTGNAAYTPINHGFDFVKFFIEGSAGEQCFQGGMNPPDDNNIYHLCTWDHIEDCDSKTKTCKVVEQPIRWENVTSRHLRVFKEFVDEYSAKDNPFFYVHSFTAVHVPWTPSRFFVSDPVMKYWTDFVNEVDWAVGFIIDYLKKHAPNTLVVLTSDNGPYKESASSFCPQNCLFKPPSVLKEDKTPQYFGCSPCEKSSISDTVDNNIGGKGTSWEGGQHVPAVAWWPGKIKAGTINPIVSSGLDLLPTFVEVAGGKLDKNIVYDGKSIAKQLYSRTVKASTPPHGTFVYWCGDHINAIRINQYKVIYRKQPFKGKTPLERTPPNLCGQGGDCCPGSPLRTCPCEWPFAQNFTIPKVIDLVENPREDLSKEVKDKPDIVKKAYMIRKNLLYSVLKDRKVPDRFFEKNSAANMSHTLGIIPNCMLTDTCFATDNLTVGPFLSGPIDGDEDNWVREEPYVDPGCAFQPDSYQKSYLPGNNFSFYEFQNCSTRVGDVGTYQGPECAQRLSCCEQDGYKGPFEYIKPVSGEENGWEGDTYPCGCFNNGGNSSVGLTSHFPDDQLMQESLCDWQKEVYLDLKARNQLYNFQGFCKPSWCANETYSRITDNQELCDVIADYGLNNVPTGIIWNAPYPESQDMTWKEIYVNQDFEPAVNKFVKEVEAYKK